MKFHQVHAPWTRLSQLAERRTREPGPGLPARAGQGSLARAGDLVEISPSTCTLVSTAPASWTSDQGTSQRQACLPTCSSRASQPGSSRGLGENLKVQSPRTRLPGLARHVVGRAGKTEARPGQAGQPLSACLPIPGTQGNRAEIGLCFISPRVRLARLARRRTRQGR